jgi:hypothetical protein
LIAIAPYLGREELIASASASLPGMKEPKQSSFIARLAKGLSKEKRSPLLDLATLVEDEETKAFLLAICTSALTVPEARRAVAIARYLTDDERRLDALRALAFESALEPTERREVLNDAFSTAKNLGDAATRVLKLEATAKAPELISDKFRSSLADALDIIRNEPKNLWKVVRASEGLPEAWHSIIGSEALTTLLLTFYDTVADSA